MKSLECDYTGELFPEIQMMGVVTAYGHSCSVFSLGINLFKNKLERIIL